MENGKETKQEQETKQVDSGDEKKEEEEGEVPRREAVPKNVPRVKSDEEEEEIVTVHFHTLRITFNMEHIWDFLGDPDSTESNGMTI